VSKDLTAVKKINAVKEINAMAKKTTKISTTNFKKWN